MGDHEHADQSLDDMLGALGTALVNRPGRVGTPPAPRLVMISTGCPLSNRLLDNLVTRPPQFYTDWHSKFAWPMSQVQQQLGG